MEIKIKKLGIAGLRGVKGNLSLVLDEKSLLLYGDNGTGKSSISDSLEWYYTDGILHLSSTEIDLKEALRNSYLAENELSSITVGFNRPSLDNERKLIFHKGKLSSEFSNADEDFKGYLSQSRNENLLLRYQLLRDFVDKTKTEKLNQLSEIIGFSEVVKAKEALKKAFNSIKTDLKVQNFETQIATQKQTLIDKIGAAVSQEENLCEKINELIKHRKTGIEVKSVSDIDRILDHFKSPANNKLIAELKFLNQCNDILSDLRKEVDFIDSEYAKYYSEFGLIASDVQSIMQTFLFALLKAGKEVLGRKYHKEQTCPLCLQPKNIEDLKNELESRLNDIEKSSKKKLAFDKAKQTVDKISFERLRRLDSLTLDHFFNDASNAHIKKAVDDLKLKIGEYQKAANEKVTSGNKLKKAEEIKLQNSDFAILATIAERIAALRNDNTTVLYSNISAAKDAFLKIKKFEATKLKLEQQQNSLKLIYDEFVKKQKAGLENFINAFSGTINDFYQYMNPGEQFQEIRIVTMGEEDELNGITIEYKYNDNWVSPPQKYFSESHLNCFGISFFLASVVAFNKANKFLVLDDVISSFDTNHRKRFADLLFEKFSDWQLILLTHEAEWFQYVRQLAKKKSWLINEVKWTDSKGTYLEEEPNELKELIEKNIESGSVDILGNPLRQYLEHILKEICLNLDVKVSFRFNDINEKRMPDELLNELKSKINRSSSELKAKIGIIDRVANSSLLGNLLSHDNPFNPKLGDLKAFWADILELERLFSCQELTCKRPHVSLRNYDGVAKKIRCGCDGVKYDWKE